MREPSGGEDQWEFVVGQFGGGQVGPRQEAGTAAGGRESQRRNAAVVGGVQILADPVVEIPDRVAVVASRGGGPLDGAAAQPFVVHAAQIPTGAGIVKTGQLGENLGGGVEVETGVSHGGRDPADQQPIR